MNINLPLDDLSANRTQTSDIPTSEVKRLCRAVDVGRTATNGYKFTAIERGDIVAELRYANLQHSEIGYVAWVEVKEMYRREGIARSLCRAAIRDLQNNGVQRVYTWPTTDAGTALADEEGFQPVENSDLSGWMVHR